MNTVRVFAPFLPDLSMNLRREKRVCNRCTAIFRKPHTCAHAHTHAYSSVEEVVHRLQIAVLPAHALYPLRARRYASAVRMGYRGSLLAAELGFCGSGRAWEAYRRWAIRGTSGQKHLACRERAQWVAEVGSSIALFSEKQGRRNGGFRCGSCHSRESDPRPAEVGCDIGGWLVISIAAASSLAETAGFTIARKGGVAGPLATAGPRIELGARAAAQVALPSAGCSLRFAKTIHRSRESERTDGGSGFEALQPVLSVEGPDHFDQRAERRPLAALQVGESHWTDVRPFGEFDLGDVLVQASATNLRAEQLLVITLINLSIVGQMYRKQQTSEGYCDCLPCGCGPSDRS